jgi:hypothetical protein
MQNTSQIEVLQWIQHRNESKPDGEPSGLPAIGKNTGEGGVFCHPRSAILHRIS